MGTSQTRPWEQGTSQTRPWAAAFMAGTEAGRIGKLNGRILDKAQLKRILQTGKMPHHSQLPTLPTHRDKLHDHLLGEMFEEAERSHLRSHKEMNSWSEIPIKKAHDHQILDLM